MTKDELDLNEARRIISNLQQQNTELLEDVAALRQERDTLKAEVEELAANFITDSNLSYDIGRRHKQGELQPTLDALKAKVEELRRRVSPL